jgi:SAM-dependent methyltransferase
METLEELSPKEGYAQWASCYDEDGNPLIALEGPALQAWFGSIAGRPVLDLGCGTGRHTLALVQAGAQVTALDQSPEMMARAKQKLEGRKIEWVLHSLPDPLPFDNESFDLVVLGLVAEHVADLDGLAAEIARVAKPEGRCLLSGLHPDRTRQGQRARFIDPESGMRRPIETIHREADDYRAAATAVGMRVVAERTLTVDAELAAELPRAAPYVGLPLGWAICLQK